eukprot:PhF_6_TR8317/c0_g3_i1/m.12915
MMSSQTLQQTKKQESRKFQLPITNNPPLPPPQPGPPWYPSHLLLQQEQDREALRLRAFGFFPPKPTVPVVGRMAPPPNNNNTSPPPRFPHMIRSNTPNNMNVRGNSGPPGPHRSMSPPLRPVVVRHPLQRPSPLPPGHRTHLFRIFPMFDFEGKGYMDKVEFRQYLYQSNKCNFM